MMKNRWCLLLAAALVVPACGTRAPDSDSQVDAGDVSDSGGDVVEDTAPDISEDVVDDVEPDPDVDIMDVLDDVPPSDTGPDVAPPCGEQPTTDCIFCERGEQVEQVCENGEYVCPDGSAPRDECPGGCGGIAPLCIWEGGRIDSVDADCNGAEGEWQCEEGYGQCDDCQWGPGSLDGTWYEIEWMLCGGGTMEPDDGIAELIFSGGEFMLTYESGLFETYRDYVGFYEYNPNSGLLEMSIDWGNQLPIDPDLSGRVRAQQDESGEDVVRFEYMWLGTGGPNQPFPGSVCGQRFARR